jgi:hypothetical protein
MAIDNSPTGKAFSSEFAQNFWASIGDGRFTDEALDDVGRRGIAGKDDFAKNVFNSKSNIDMERIAGIELTNIDSAERNLSSNDKLNAQQKEAIKGGLEFGKNVWQEVQSGQSLNDAIADTLAKEGTAKGKADMAQFGKWTNGQAWSYGQELALNSVLANSAPANDPPHKPVAGKPGVAAASAAAAGASTLSAGDLQKLHGVLGGGAHAQKFGVDETQKLLSLIVKAQASPEYQRYLKAHPSLDQKGDGIYGEGTREALDWMAKQKPPLLTPDEQKLATQLAETNPKDARLTGRQLIGSGYPKRDPETVHKAVAAAGAAMNAAHQPAASASPPQAQDAAQMAAQAKLGDQMAADAAAHTNQMAFLAQVPTPAMPKVNPNRPNYAAAKPCVVTQNPAYIMAQTGSVPPKMVDGEKVTTVDAKNSDGKKMTFAYIDGPDGSSVTTSQDGKLGNDKLLTRVTMGPDGQITSAEMADGRGRMIDETEHAQAAQEQRAQQLAQGSSGQQPHNPPATASQPAAPAQPAAQTIPVTMSNGRMTININGAVATGSKNDKGGVDVTTTASDPKGTTLTENVHTEANAKKDTWSLTAHTADGQDYSVKGKGIPTNQQIAQAADKVGKEAENHIAGTAKGSSQNPPRRTVASMGPGVPH